jgi:hypothetical protein
LRWPPSSWSGGESDLTKRANAPGTLAVVADCGELGFSPRVSFSLRNHCYFCPAVINLCGKGPVWVSTNCFLPGLRRRVLQMNAISNRRFERPIARLHQNATGAIRLSFR